MVQELFSVLKAINHVIKKSQSNEQICIVSFSLLQMAYFGLYIPLVIYDTEKNIVEEKNFNELHDLTRSVLKILPFVGSYD